MTDTAVLSTLRDWLRYAVSRFQGAGLFFGHGSVNAYDEAANLILHTLHLPAERLETFLDARLTPQECDALAAILKRRIEERLPAAYLTHEAWLGDFKFYVDERVIVPRSYLAELLEDSLAPWIPEPEAVENALDLGTGSGCLAVLMAYAFPNARIDASDVSPEGLEVAQRNICAYGLEERVRLLHSDLFAALGGRRYDLIISNPPYVTTAALQRLPPEHRHEPDIALRGGDDGLDLVRRLLQSAGRYLKPEGLLAVEVGHNRTFVEAAFPRLQPIWLTARDGDEKVFLLRRDQLSALAG
jgi:ribosomal protein L3 glutamine methyltransferase